MSCFSWWTSSEENVKPGREVEGRVISLGRTTLPHTPVRKDGASQLDHWCQVLDPQSIMARLLTSFLSMEGKMVWAGEPIAKLVTSELPDTHSGENRVLINNYSVRQLALLVLKNIALPFEIVLNGTGSEVRFDTGGNVGVPWIKEIMKCVQRMVAERFHLSILWIRLWNVFRECRGSHLR